MADPDIIPKYVPALSSTGDVPVFLSPPPASEEDATPPSPSPDGGLAPATSPVAPAGGEGDEPETGGEPPAKPPEAEPPAEPPEPPRPDARTARIRAAEERATRLEGMLERALAALENRTQAPPPAPPAPPPVVAPDPKPQRADFDNPEDYDSALVEWGSRKVLAEYEARTAAKEAAEKAAAGKQEAEDKAAAGQKAINDQWMSRRQEAITKHADYADAEATLIEETNEFNAQQTAAITAVIMTTTDGPALAYHLGKNPAEAKRIALIPDPMAQVFEMAKISAKLAQPKPVEVSRTPAPITPLRGPTRAVERTLEEVGNEGSMEEYAAMKKAKRAAEFTASQAGRRPH